jgi:GNAT superfamily N-acetyltransferase
MQLSDVPRVAEIHVFGWRSAFRGMISDEFLFKKRLVSLSITRFENALYSNSEEIYVFDDGIIKAFISICACRDEDKTESFELGGIYVEPLMKRQGIGSIMIDYCEKTAAERGYKEVCLWTLEKNTTAKAFYEKSGYLLDGSKKFLENIEAMAIRYSKKFRAL